MKNVYLIFTNPNDVYSNVTVICSEEELDSVLIEEGMIEPGTTMADYNWVVFENGNNMIQG